MQSPITATTRVPAPHPHPPPPLRGLMAQAVIIADLIGEAVAIFVEDYHIFDV
jgi:hypothetical protein